MKLGPIELPTDLILAPLMDTTTPSFRQLICDIGGVGMVVTPMIFVKQVAKAPKTILPHLEHIENQRPSSLQIVTNGKSEEDIKKALDIINSYDFDVLDINGGCPALHTMRYGGGGGLLKKYHNSGTTEHLEKIIRYCNKYSDKPVSFKTRLGFQNEEDILVLSKVIEENGGIFISLHGRTVKQKYGGCVNLEMIKKVKENINIPIVGNGNVVDYKTYKKMKDITGCDAVMIGRAVMNDPAVFHKIWKSKQATKNNEEIPVFTKHMDLHKIREYLRKDEEFISKYSKYWNTDRFKFAEMRRLTIWFIKGIPGYRRVRERLSKMENLNLLKDYIFSDKIEKDFTDEAP